MFPSQPRGRSKHSGRFVFGRKAFNFRRMKKNSWLIVFLLVAVGVMARELFGLQEMGYLLKPLIIPTLAAYFWQAGRGAEPKIRQMALGALLFSWIGDVLLMFSGLQFGFFIAGLVGFLVAQFFYIVLFWREISRSGKISYLKRKPEQMLWLLGYGLVLYLLLFNRLDPVLRIAILFYSVAILGMVAMALNRKGMVSSASFWFTFSGALLFLASDSMIAINRFYTPVPKAGCWIMLTYLAAQLLIISGIIRNIPAQADGGR